MSQENENMEVVEVTPKKKKKSKKPIIITIIVVAVLLFIVVIANIIKGVSASMEEAMSAMGGENEATYTVERQDVEQEITTSGTVVGIDTKAYVSPVTAKVEDVCVEVGQLVKKGDVLLTYDASELGDNLEKVKIQAQSERAAGNASYEAADEAAGKVTAAEKKVKDYKKDIKSLKAEIESLNDQITALQDQLADAEAKNAKAEQAAATPKEDGTTEAPQLVDTKPITAQIRSLTKTLNNKTESLTNKQSKLAEQQGIISANEDVKVSASTKAQVEASNTISNMNIDDAQESYDAAQAGITVETDGIVESISVVEGAYASETQTVMTIIDADSIGVEFSIAKDDLGSIAEGQKARVVIGGHEYEGTVEYISRVAVTDALLAGSSNTSTGGNIKGRIILQNPDDNIYIGVSAKAYIFIGSSEQALAIPYVALNTDIDGDFVYVVNDKGIIERKNVKIGIYSDEYYEVLEGIEEGDVVIKNVTSDMKPGDPYLGAGVAIEE